ncbi:hypothetical protein [Mycoplasma sp. Mirounga ES2805-ORL]|uniref:hypothetical protein n=1 Tax=Mycoplasma sp. Mirounga ES2805-ORL TaxID=754514 RepID=UPI00197B7A8D|nr:hypothetical protein [Mycoplasma sp. Mirounga ES2805-ORL]QSF13862.1 hypothetical protein JXZ90_00990 [Mycoplasma sp. Mirounga ES2805-ORL]
MANTIITKVEFNRRLKNNLLLIKKSNKVLWVSFVLNLLSSLTVLVFFTFKYLKLDFVDNTSVDLYFYIFGSIALLSSLIQVFFGVKSVTCLRNIKSKLSTWVLTACLFSVFIYLGSLSIYKFTNYDNSNNLIVIIINCIPLIAYSGLTIGALY